MVCIDKILLGYGQRQIVEAASYTLLGRGPLQGWRNSVICKSYIMIRECFINGYVRTDWYYVPVRTVHTAMLCILHLHVRRPLGL